MSKCIVKLTLEMAGKPKAFEVAVERHKPGTGRYAQTIGDPGALGL